ncbi:hypothetical protein UFOVP1648_25 [uncultured Caudovirales phage]|uniref:Bacteriophage lambda, Stf, side tail fibre-repeat-2 n=1 Tax=uncultured Caudovirales phage TaxID=2100421 RepID=A0A6J5T2W0_9CAUD|nr:hypothetical protein UFOVP1648_25 [uncultured Caudovirales phage]
MAKQTFTTGQVLTAAEMTSLQQTAMGGGATTAKTTSYVLVAADAGTVVQMNAAGATTITINTALFSAGDTVQIQNIGAGICTITAGTATVNTSSTLALKQYDSGDLYFNTTGAAFFFSTDAADSTSPLTTKGDLYGYSTLDARIPIGTNNQVLTADSAQALGLKWATPTAAFTTIASGSLSSSSVVISSIPATYKQLRLVVENFTPSASGGDLQLRLNGDSSAHYAIATTGYSTGGTFGDTLWKIAYNQKTASYQGLSVIDFPDYANTTTWKLANIAGITNNGTTATNYDYAWYSGLFNQIAAISSMTLSPNSGTFTGTYSLLGLA